MLTTSSALPSAGCTRIGVLRVPPRRRLRQTSLPVVLSSASITSLSIAALTISKFSNNTTEFPEPQPVTLAPTSAFHTSAPSARFRQYTPDAPAALAELRARHGIDIPHWQEAIDDYDETAALVSALDLTVSVCTSLVHLCGALGRPVWVMAPLAPEWRYGMTGETMPWYSSVRIFRQTAYGDWAPVIERVAAAMRA